MSNTPLQALSLPMKGASNLTLRWLTAAVVAPVIILLLFEVPAWGFLTFLGIATLTASLEFSAMTLPKSFLLRGFCTAASLAVFLAFTLPGSSERLGVATLLSTLLGGFIVSIACSKLMFETPSAIGWILAGPFYIGLLLSTIGHVYLRPHGGAWVLFTLMVAWLGDTGGYFAGKSFGHKPLHLTISPNKTREGALGGLLGSVCAALLAHFWYLPSLPLVAGIALAIIGGAAGQLGDLAESLIKRTNGVKDSGTLVPGHGGILDRIDAVLFTAPMIWMYVEWFSK